MHGQYVAIVESGGDAPEFPEALSATSGSSRLFTLVGTPVPCCQDGRTLKEAVLVLQPPPDPLQPTSVDLTPDPLTVATVPPTIKTSGS